MYLEEKVDLLLEKLNRLLPEANEHTQLTNSQIVNAVNELFIALNNHDKIRAIIAYRTLTGVGLKEAKDYIEHWWWFAVSRSET